VPKKKKNNKKKNYEKKKKKKKKLPNLTQTGTQQDNPHEIEDGEA